MSNTVELNLPCHLNSTISATFKFNSVALRFNLNFSAVMKLIEGMCRNSVKSLVHVSDALACLAPGENFGVTETSTLDPPPSPLVGVYGETKYQGELIARSAADSVMFNGETK